jgi:hypothetical protein
MDTLPRIYVHGCLTKEYVPSIHAHSFWSTPTPVEWLNLNHRCIFHCGNIVWDLFLTTWLTKL